MIFFEIKTAVDSLEVSIETVLFLGEIFESLPHGVLYPGVAKSAKGIEKKKINLKSIL